MSWQPIETAPKDGSRIVVIVYGIQFIALWHESAGEWCIGGGNYIDTPTHWMPLPEPPK